MLATVMLFSFQNVSIHLCFRKKWISFSIIFLFWWFDICLCFGFEFGSFAIFLFFFFSTISFHFIYITQFTKLSDSQALVNQFNGDNIYNNYCFHLIRYIVDLSRFVPTQHSSHEQKANNGIRCVKLNECLMENKWLTSQ